MTTPAQYQSVPVAVDAMMYDGTPENAQLMTEWIDNLPIPGIVKTHYFPSDQAYYIIFMGAGGVGGQVVPIGHYVVYNDYNGLRTMWPNSFQTDFELVV